MLFASWPMVRCLISTVASVDKLKPSSHLKVNTWDAGQSPPVMTVRC